MDKREKSDQAKKLEEAIKNALQENRLPCAKAFLIAEELKVTKKEVGQTCNRIRVKISRCQLGCFE